jgi:acyl-CoA synthetase (AMP-forming)/AMP-acid ligase II
MNISDPIRNHALRRPNHPAVITRTNEVRYRAFEVGINRGARMLMDMAIGRGDIVGVALGDSAEHLALLFSIVRIGAVVLPIDRRWTQGELSRVVSHFGAKLVLCETGDPEVEGVRTVAVEEGLFDESVPVEPVASAEGGDNPLMLSLSSGTTGRPKGPMLTHNNYLHRFQIYFISATFNEHDRFASTSPLYFTGSRAFCMAFAFAGATNILLPPPVSAAQLIKEINLHRATAAFAVPTMLRRWMEVNQEEKLCFPDMRLLLLTGSAVFPEDWERAHRKVARYLINFYGSAEGAGATVLTSTHPPEMIKSVGTVAYGSVVRIVDAEFKDVPAGTQGRICYRSPATASEYYNDPEETAKAFRDGWYCPGDLGYLDENGFLFITGREKDLIIRGGINIYPNEIESILQTHPSISEAAVVGIPSAEFGEEVAGVFVASQVLDRDALRDFCKQQLASYKVPKLFYPVSEMPKTSVGKIDKKAVREAVQKLSPI